MVGICSFSAMRLTSCPLNIINGPRCKTQTRRTHHFVSSDRHPSHALTFGILHDAPSVLCKAVGGLWGGPCTPAMMTTFAEKMLEQVVLRAQGGSGERRKSTSSFGYEKRPWSTHTDAPIDTKDFAHGAVALETHDVHSNLPTYRKAPRSRLPSASLEH